MQNKAWLVTMHDYPLIYALATCLHNNTILMSLVKFGLCQFKSRKHVHMYVHLQAVMAIFDHTS